MSIYKFSPDLMAEEDLDFISVGRDKLISEIIDKIENVTSKNLSTYILLVGQRGIGKTHTLLRIYHSLGKKNNFKTIRLSEEEYAITDVESLFKRILEEMHVQINGNAIDTALKVFSKLKNEGRTPIVFVDNLQMLFEQIEHDLPKLRSLLQEHNPFCIIGSALTVFHAISSHDEPFYNFMDVIFLKGLDDTEIYQLIKKRFEKAKKDELLKDFNQYEERIKGVQILTGGNPRLIHSLCEILIQKNTLDELESNLLELLDQLTPYYQARMESLPITQRKIIDILSKEPGPINPTHLANVSNMKINSVVTQLRRLESVGIVESIKFRDKKETLYQISERLYRIWREMRSPIGTKRIKLFTDFLKIWFSRDELYNQYNEFTNEFDENFYDSKELARKKLIHACYIADSIPDMKVLDFENNISRFIVINELESANSEIKKMEEWVKTISHPIVNVVAKDSLLSAKYFLSRQDSRYGNPDDDLRLLRKHEDKLMEIAKTTKKLDRFSRLWLHEALHKCAPFYSSRNEYDKAEEIIDLSLKMVDGDCSSALMEKAKIYMEKNDYNNALKILKTIPKKDEDIDSKLLTISTLKKINEDEKALQIAYDVIKNEQSHEIFGILEALNLSAYDEIEKIVNHCISKLIKKDSEKNKIISNGIIAHLIHKLAHGIDHNDQNVPKVLTIIKKLSNKYGVYNINRITFPTLYEFAKAKKYQVCISLLDNLNSIHSDFKEPIIPFRKAIEYIQTKNTDILEKLHKETRDMVFEIIQSLEKDIEIPQEIRSST